MTDTTDRPIRRFIAWMVIALFVVIADQATKWAIVEWVDLYGRVPINSFINITHQQNTGAAFSFLAGAGGWQRWFFVTLATVVSAVIAVWLWRLRNEGPLVLMAGLVDAHVHVNEPGTRRRHRQSHRSRQAGIRD